MSEDIDVILARTGLENKLIDEITTIGRLKKVKAGQIVVSPESPGNEMPIVLSGLLKVLRQDPNGQEVFLYYLEGGETCAMSITCCIEGKKSSFKVLAEEDSTIWMIPMGDMDKWITKYPSFRRFVFSSYQMRFDELLTTIDSVVFHKMDERLYKYLLDTKQATGSFEIHKTHEQIANELSTSRVVISRLLKQLEKEDKIEQGRNKIEIL
ncbi:MAG: Crp/Fnr family transcriptional regulator [Cyclobacteriaceae bacterium]